MSTTGGKILHVLESLALALFLTFGTCMLLMLTAMLFAKGPGDGQMFTVGIYIMPLYPIIFVYSLGMSCVPITGRLRVRDASKVLLALLLFVIAAGWIKNLVSA